MRTGNYANDDNYSDDVDVYDDDDSCRDERDYCVTLSSLLLPCSLYARKLLGKGGKREREEREREKCERVYFCHIMNLYEEEGRARISFRRKTARTFREAHCVIVSPAQPVKEFWERMHGSYKAEITKSVIK